MSTADEYKVCILAAGKGLRLGNLTRSINKCLLPVNGKAVLTHAIEKFNPEIEIVIAVGYESEKVKEYVKHAHIDRKITFVDVENYDKIGAGPGQSLLECKKYLNCPFILAVGDAIVKDVIPPPDINWMGLSEIQDDSIENYCSLTIDNGKIVKLVDKEKCDNKYAFIGIAGVKNHKEFWDSLENNTSLIKNEKQVSNGFKRLIDHNLRPETFDWIDTGTVENYTIAKKRLEGVDSFDFSKIDEFIYFVNDRVIKYFAEKKQIDNRYSRSILLKESCPKIIKKTNHFMSYKHIKGKTVYSVLNPGIVSIFFKWCQKNLWKSVETDNTNFKNLCKSFYFDKTFKRLEKFYQKYPEFNDKNVNINNEECPNIHDLLAKIDWDLLFDGIPVTFHGDLQFDNVLRTGWSEKEDSSFKVIDWRGDFAGSDKVGDLYYDLAKLYGGLTLPYILIKNNYFSFENENNSNVNYDFRTKHMIVESKNRYEKLLIENGYDLKKIKVMTGIIFLNMSPLHHYPFDHLLYHLSRYYLNSVL